MQYRCEVIKGRGRGKNVVKFPTFNLQIPAGFETAAREGVYACHVWIEGKKYRGALHYGPTPTFDEKESVLEIFVLEYDSDQPVNELTFELGPYLRPVATFSDPQKLRTQIALDVQRVRRAIKLDSK
jgi:riboflavin kinase / FMN adenylyltransferase